MFNVEINPDTDGFNIGIVQHTIKENWIFLDDGTDLINVRDYLGLKKTEGTFSKRFVLSFNSHRWEFSSDLLLSFG